MAIAATKPTQDEAIAYPRIEVYAVQHEMVEGRDVTLQGHGDPSLRRQLPTRGGSQPHRLAIALPVEQTAFVEAPHVSGREDAAIGAESSREVDAPRHAILGGRRSSKAYVCKLVDDDVTAQISLASAMTSLVSQVASAPRQLLNAVLKEVLVTYQIVWRDLSASLIPATLFGLAALQATAGWTLASVTQTLLRSFAYFSLYIYSFCLCNQIVGYREDRVNKPDRVLPSKTITMHGALARWLLAMIAFPLVGLALGGARILGWALAWQAIFLIYNFLGLHQHWFTKNAVFITLGTIVQLTAAWELVAPLEAVAWRWILVVAVSFGFTLHLQDLRDIQGDRLVGRKTLPIAIGQQWTRRLLATGIGVLPLVTHFGLFADATLRPSVLLIEVMLTALNVVVAARTLRLRSPQADHRTYILHTYWFCAVLASGVVVL